MWTKGLIPSVAVTEDRTEQQLTNDEALILAAQCGPSPAQMQFKGTVAYARCGDLWPARYVYAFRKDDVNTFYEGMSRYRGGSPIPARR